MTAEERLTALEADPPAGWSAKRFSVGLRYARTHFTSTEHGVCVSVEVIAGKTLATLSAADRGATVAQLAAALDATQGLLRRLSPAP